MQHNNDPLGPDEPDMGRPPAVTDDELVTILQSALDWPAIAAVETATVSAALNGVPAQTVRNRLRACRDTMPAQLRASAWRAGRLGLVAH